nr:uncharacterized protein LOC103421347 isoform X4 [Malus domestica]XP_028945634.1 uncharacterized protein LOC103421347 isoform X4 [Malus domestica]XP_028945636.1 uncharacterized protein LOC103421347 isoform X4 [Malus domestica]
METQSKDGDSLEKRPGIFFLGSPGVVERSLISQALPMYEQLAALILVFDTTELSSLSALQKWVSQTDLQKFDRLVCIGNKVDLVPGHPVHTEYRRRLQKLGDPFADDGPGFTAYGISETEGSSLLGDDEPYWEARHTCLEWCNEHNIEFVEACASNADFDKCKVCQLMATRKVLNDFLVLFPHICGLE